MVLLYPTAAQKTGGCCTNNMATFAFLLQQLFVLTNHYQCKSSHTDQVMNLSWHFCFILVEEEAVLILGLYWLKSDSVMLSVLSPVLVLMPSHPNKPQGCRKNCARLISTATPRWGACAQCCSLITQLTENSHDTSPAAAQIPAEGLSHDGFVKQMYLLINTRSFLTVKW